MSVLKNHLIYAGKVALPAVLALSVANSAATQDDIKWVVKERITKQMYNNDTTISSDEGFSQTATMRIRGKARVAKGEETEYRVYLGGLFTDEVKIAIGVEKECGSIIHPEFSILTLADELKLPDDHMASAERIKEFFREDLDNFPGWVANDRYDRAGARVTEGDIRQYDIEAYNTRWQQKISPLGVSIPIIFRKSGYLKACAYYNVDEEYFVWSDMLFVEVGD